MEISNAAADQLAEVIASYVNDNGDDRVQLIGEVLGEDSSGTTWVHILGGEQRTPVTSTNAKVHKGDIVYVVIGDGRADILGNVSRPSTDDTLAEVVQQRVVETERVVERIEATAITADSAEIQQLNADHAVIETLDSTYASISSLNAATARIGDIEADYLVAADMTAEQARVGQLMAGKADVADLTAANARIDSLESTKADISVLESDYITADAIDATYLHADMSNADVAWIQNGVIKDGSISNAMINSLSANKLTAGTINGSVINVTNLNADNITAGTINGQRIGEGSLSLDKLSEDVYTEQEVDNKLSAMQAEIDGAIETWTGTAVPTLNNSPASGWNTSDERDRHVGDVYFVVNSQSEQNGYNYRFTKSGNTYSWQLIKDSDVTNALQRLSTAEGKITTFDSDISTLKTDTGTLKTKTESLETRMSDAEDDILDKVDTTTFNEVSDTVDQHSQTITQMSQTLSNKADGSTVTALTTRVSKTEQDITGINTTIGELQDTVETKADGSTVSTISNKLNTVSDTVDGHTQTLTSVQNTLSSKADSSTVSTLTTKVNNVSDTVDGHTQTISGQSTILSNNGLTSSTNITNRVSSVEQDLSGYKTTVSETYATQTALATTNGNVAAAQTAADNAQAAADKANGRQVAYSATSSTGATTAAKVAACANFPALAAGATVTVRFSAANTSTGAVTLNVNSTGAKTVYVNGSATSSSNQLLWGANANITFTYDGSYWRVDSEPRTWYGTGSVAAATAAKTATINEVVICKGTTVVLNMTNENTSTSATLNVTSTGAKNIYYGTTTTRPTTANGYGWGAGSTVSLTFDGQYWRIGDTTALARLTAAESTISSHTTSISQNATAIALKADSSTTYTKTDVDGLITTEVSNRNAAITAKANEITSSVSETYATKTAVNGKADASDVTALAGRVTTAESNITQNAQNIELKVSKDGVISSINQSAETVKIQASKVEIDGTAIFSAISSDVDDAITDKGYQTASQVNTAITSKGYATTTQAQGYATTAENNAKNDTTNKLKSYSTTAQANNLYDAKGDAQAVQNNLNNNTRSCLVGQSGNTTTNPWYKVASTTITAQYVDVIAVFDVFNSGGFGAVNRSGRLTVHVRAGTGVNSVELPAATWESRGVGVVLSDFVLAYKLTAGSKIDVELWCRCPYTYTGYLFKVVYEGNRTAIVPNTWTLYNTWTAGSQSAITSGYTQVVSTDVNAAQATADAAAPKASAVKRTQRIWYRKSASGAPATPGTASSNWVVKADDGSNAWTKMHVAISSTEKFIYTCEQYEMANGTIGYTSVLLDNTITVIDGGSIITDSITANQIAAGTITGNEIAGGTITSDNIEAGAISADRLDANALTVGNIAGLEDQLETITNGISSLSNSTQWVHFQDSVGTVFGEAGSANNVTVKADGVYFNTEGGEAARASAGIFYSNEMQANDSISTPILKMGNWALMQSGTTFSIEYLG